MSLITTLRQRRRLRARTVLAAFMLVWLNVVLQPCVMAMPVSDVASDQLAHQHESQSKAAHGQHDEHDDCPHCAVFGAVNCGEGDGCDEPDVVQSNGTIKLKDTTPRLMAVLPVPDLALHTGQLLRAASILPRAAPPPPGPAISIRYCVYLT